MKTFLSNAPGARPRLWSAILVGVVTVAALLGIANSISIAVNAARTTNTWVVTVPVRATSALPADMPQTGLIIDQTPEMSWMPTSNDGELVMWLEHADPLTSLLANPSRSVAWLTIAVVSLILLPVLRTITAGRPFAPGNARHLGAAGITTAIAWAVVSILPVVAAERAITAELGHVPAAWFEPRFDPQLWPLAFAGFIVVLAVSVRAGARVAAETEGLV